MVTGDFNGDGTDEIVGLRGGEAIVFDPYRQPGESDVATSFTAAPAGQTWKLAVTGNFYGNNRDGLVLLQTLNQGSLKARMRSFFFDPVSGWTANWSEDFGALFVGLAAGDVDGDNRDELAGIRAVTGSNLIIILETEPNWARIFEGNYGYPWVAIAIGDVVEDTQNKDEIVTTRSGVGSNLTSYLVFRWVNSSSALQDVAGDKFNPNFRWIALADVTGNGDDEVYLLRPGSSGGVAIVALTSRNYGNDGGQRSSSTNWQDRLGSAISMAATWTPMARMKSSSWLPTSTSSIPSPPPPSPSQLCGPFSTGLSFAVGNLDGAGIPQGPRLSVTPTTVSLYPAVRTDWHAGRSDLELGHWHAHLDLHGDPGRNLAQYPTHRRHGADRSDPADRRRESAAGGYTGTVRISGQAGTSGSPQDVTVNLTVTAPPSPRLQSPLPQISLSVESGQTATRRFRSPTPAPEPQLDRVAD